jgi:serine/threonine protein kinase
MDTDPPEGRGDPERADRASVGSGSDGPREDRSVILPETEERPASPEGSERTGAGPGSVGRSDDEEAIPADLEGHLFGKYRAVRKLGQGGMGSDWLVEHVGLEQHRALKIIRSDLVDSPPNLDRFRREARILAKLSRHPNAVVVYDTGLVDGIAYIEMDSIDGRTLRKRLDEGGLLPLRHVAWILGEICAVLGEAHRQGIVHRDIKPQNVMIVPDRAVARGERVKVLDFGVAKLIRDPTADTASPPQALAGAGRQAANARTTLHTDSFVGTIPYSAPEQLGPLQARQTQAVVDQRSDIYSLGVMLYEMLAGTRPFSGTQTQILYDHAHTPPHRFAETAPDVHVPPAVEAVVRRCLEKNPANRPQSAGELLRLFQAASEEPDGAGETAESDEPAVPPRPSTVRGQSRPGVPWRTRWRAVAALLVAGLLVVALAWTLRSRAPTPTPSAPLTSVGSLQQKSDGVALRANSGILNRDATVAKLGQAEREGIALVDVPPGPDEDPVTITIGADKEAWKRKYRGVNLSTIKDQFQDHPHREYTHLGKPLDFVLTVRNQLPKRLEAKCLVELTDPANPWATWGQMKLFEHVLSLGRRGSSADTWTFAHAVSLRYAPDDTRVLKVTLEAANPADPAGNPQVERWKRGFEVMFSQVTVSSYLDVEDRFDPHCSTRQQRPDQRCYIVKYSRRRDDPFTEPIGADEWLCKIVDSSAVPMPEWVFLGSSWEFHYYPADRSIASIPWSGWIENQEIVGNIGQWRPK